MKAIQVQKPGGPEVMSLVELPIPKAGPNEAVVKLSAAGVNYIDVYLREGQYPTTFPFINGQEGAGVVSEVEGGVGVPVHDEIGAHQYTGEQDKRGRRAPRQTTVFTAFTR